MRDKRQIKHKTWNSAETPRPMEVAAPSNRPERRTKCMTSLERVKYTLKRNFRPRAGGRARGGRVAWRGGRAMAEHGENVKRACRVCLSFGVGRLLSSAKKHLFLIAIRGQKRTDARARPRSSLNIRRQRADICTDRTDGMDGIGGTDRTGRGRGHLHQEDGESHKTRIRWTGGGKMRARLLARRTQVSFELCKTKV